MRPSLWREPRAVSGTDPWPRVSKAYAQRQLSPLQEIGLVSRTLAILERPACRPLIMQAWTQLAREILVRQCAIDHALGQARRVQRAVPAPHAMRAMSPVLIPLPMVVGVPLRWTRP